MTPGTLIERLDAAIAGYGQTVTLQRTAVDAATGGVTVADEVTCPAAVRNFGPQSLEAGESQEIRVVLSPTGLGSFGIPSRDDILVIDGNPSNIQEIAPLSYGGTLCRVNLLCRG
jgi:hypothetical protein